jgi:hypothetical protein
MGSCGSRRGTRWWVRRRPPLSEERCRARRRDGTEAELGAARASSAAGGEGSSEFAWVRRWSSRHAAACGAVTTEIERGRSAAAHRRRGSGGGARGQARGQRRRWREVGRPECTRGRKARWRRTAASVDCGGERRRGRGGGGRARRKSNPTGPDEQ